MNVYKNLEILNDASFSELLKEAENNKKQISDVIFDKKKILDFNKEYDIFNEEHIEYIMTALDEILCDEGYISLCCAMYHFMKNDACIDGLKPPEDGSLKSEFALMLPLIAKMADFCEDGIKRGLKKEFLSTTLKAVDNYLDSNKRRKGRQGTSGYHFWLPRYAKGKLFRIGAFQFEIRSFKGEEALGVHIPNGTKLNVEENLANFRLALDFFNTHYSEMNIKYFVCESWLLNPYVEEIMGRKTNISRFGDMFERFELEEEEEGVFISVFSVLVPESLDSLCEETSLQRNIKKFLKEGNRFLDYGGYIKVENIK